MVSPMVALRALWSNPVVTRDLRVRMRGTKSYWQQGAYLLLVCVLAAAGYTTATQRYGQYGGMSVVQMQGQLQEFYYFIFMTLAAMVCLIAPALTAGAITTERQRLTLDLLVTTPMTSGELLIGKLISSLAFLLLLLALSIPPSALCVILGGATITDVFQVYLLLAIDGILLASIGLYFSCATRNSLSAMVWTYLVVIIFLCVTSPFGALLSNIGRMGTGSNPMAMIAALNPFLAVLGGAGSVELAGVHVPIWVGTMLVALLFLRLLLTAASYRMGNYGGNPVGSLRWQLLFVTALTGVIVSISLASLPGYFTRGMPGSSSGIFLEYLLSGAFLIASLFLPSLFTPAAPLDAPPGEEVDGRYRLREMFQPTHAGSLPYFHLWLLVLIVSLIAPLAITAPIDDTVWVTVFSTVLYLSALGTLYWSVARRAASVTRDLSQARLFAFVILVAIIIVPLAIGQYESFIWILSPLGKVDRPDAGMSLVWESCFIYALSVVIFPYWQKVIPGGRAFRKPQEVTHVGNPS